MRLWNSGVALLALTLTTLSCSEKGAVSPEMTGAPSLSAAAAATGSMPAVRISEFHYDNASTDAGERIEVSAPLGTNLSGWTLVLYNGSNGARYNTRAVNDTIAGTCGDRKVTVSTYLVNGIQNGDPDAIALVAPDGQVVEFLSYGGSFTATPGTANGPAQGMTAVDVGVKESGTTPVGHSLQRDGVDVWYGPLANTFGACNDNDGPASGDEVRRVTVKPRGASIDAGTTQQFAAYALDVTGAPFADRPLTWSSTNNSVATVTGGGLATGRQAGSTTITATVSNGVSGSASLSVRAVQPPATFVVINELMADPLRAPGGASFGEWFEVHNRGTNAVDLLGWTIASAGQPAHAITKSVVVPAGGYAVLGRGDDVCRNGRLTIDYNYFTGTSASTIFLDNTDYLLLRDGSGALVDSVRWTTSGTMARGITRALRDAAAENANVGGDNWGYSTVPFGDGDYGTPGAANGTLSATAPVTPNWISFTGRLCGDPALPVGFEDQLFAALRDGNGNTLESPPFTWSSDAPGLASIDEDGVMRALAAGEAVIRATAAGVTGTYRLPTRVGVASKTAKYEGNAEFGEPTDADPSDDFLIERPEFTSSFSRARGTPNWVSYNLEVTHFGDEDRCDCFTYDPELPADGRYTTADYTGAGAFAGYGIDRGHLARSFDRTSASLDNARTFYFSNIVPQAADQNQGPWAVMENDLGDSARLYNREVYIVAGVAGNKGTVKGEGKIVIPEVTWKVAVIMPRDGGLDDVKDHGDVEIIAVIMPNIPGIRNVDWKTYITTVNAVEAESGYDVLALLPDDIERIVEGGLSPSLAAVEQLVASQAANEGVGTSLAAKLDAAAAQLDAGNSGAARGQLQALVHELDALERAGQLGAAEADAVRALVRQVIESIR